MLNLPQSAVPNWHIFNGKQCPVSINALCPNCARLVNFTFGNQQWDANRDTLVGSGNCPSCRKKSHFWIINPVAQGGNAESKCDAVFMYPIPHAHREPILAESDLEEAAVFRAYKSAVDAYNAGLWDACATSCRKTLEGVVKTKYPGANTSLFKQLNEVFSDKELLEPMRHLVDTLRKGGNLGAHFDLERETDRDMADSMLDFLDFIMNYIYLLKLRSEDLEQRLKAQSE